MYAMIATEARFCSYDGCASPNAQLLTSNGGRVLHPDEDTDVSLDGYFGALFCAAKLPNTHEQS
jgi:hypothetical protein